MKRSNWLGSTALGSLGAVVLMQGLIGDAQADSLFIRDRNIGVFDRVRPEFAAQGVRAGQFILKPKLDLGVGYTSNAFAFSNAPAAAGFDKFEDESDTYFIFRPSVRVDSTWSRHAISAGAYLETFANRRFDSDAITNYGAFITGQLDLTRQSALFAGGSIDRLTESRRVNTQAVLLTDPIRYDLTQGYFGGQLERGRFRYRGRLDISKYDFDDVDILPVPELLGQSGNQDFRDRTSYSMLGKVAFAVGRDVSIFFSSAYNFQEYDSEIGEAQFDRDSEGWLSAIGAEFDLTRLIRGSFAVGKFRQQYDDDRFEDRDGLSVEGSLEWFPTELTTVTLRGRRGIGESAITAASGVILEEVTVRVDHEVKRNIIAYGLAGIGKLSYPGKIPVTPIFDETGDIEAGELIPNLRTQVIDRYHFGVGAVWYANPNLSASLDYTFENQDVVADLFNGGFDTDHNIHQLLLTVSLKR